MPVFRATTVMSVRHGGTVAIAGDGQVSIGQTVVKAAARPVTAAPARRAARAS